MLFPSPENSEFQFKCRAFGLNLASTLPIPGLNQKSDPGGTQLSPPDVRIKFGSLPPDFNEKHFPEVWFESRYKTPTGDPLVRIHCSETDPRNFWIRYDEGVNFVVCESASRVWASWPEGYFFEDTVTYLLGPVMAFLCQVRGTTCLHGSAIAVDGRAIILVGPQGAGKSTTAAAFARAGFPLISDDLILLQESEQGLTVEPSYPVLRLWPESVTHLFGDADALPRISPSWDKRGFNTSEDGHLFQANALPLAAVFFLGPRGESELAPTLTPIAGTSALVRLVSNSWGHYAARPEILARQLRVFTLLSRTVPLAEVVAHRDAARLGDLRRLILDSISPRVVSE